MSTTRHEVLGGAAVKECRELFFEQTPLREHASTKGSFELMRTVGVRNGSDASAPLMMSLDILISALISERDRQIKA